MNATSNYSFIVLVFIALSALFRRHRTGLMNPIFRSLATSPTTFGLNTPKSVPYQLAVTTTMATVMHLSTMAWALAAQSFWKNLLDVASWIQLAKLPRRVFIDSLLHGSLMTIFHGQLARPLLSIVSFVTSRWGLLCHPTQLLETMLHDSLWKCMKISWRS